MPRPSSIALLDEEFRTKIADLIKEHVTYEDIADMLNAELEEAGLDIRISKSAVGRYGKDIKETAARMAETQEFASGLAMKLGEKEGDQTFDLIVEMLSHLMFKCLRAQTIDDMKKAFNTSDFMKMAVAVKTLAEAKLKDINYQREVEQEMRKRAAEIAGDVLREKGMTADTIEATQRDILGMKRPQVA